MNGGNHDRMICVLVQDDVILLCKTMYKITGNGTFKLDVQPCHEAWYRHVLLLANKI